MLKLRIEPTCERGQVHTCVCTRARHAWGGGQHALANPLPLTCPAMPGRGNRHAAGRLTLACMHL